MDYNLFNKSVPHHDEFQDKIGEIIKKYVAGLPNEVVYVIEGGSGTGLTTIRILEADTRITVVGVDNEKTIVDQARAILVDYGKRVFIQEDDLLEALRKMPTASADVFVSAWVLHNFTPQYRSVLFPEIARVLKVGGLFINGDKYARSDAEAHQHDMDEQIRAFDVFEVLGRPDLTQAWTEHYQEDEKIKITEDEQIQLLDEAGFSGIKIPYRKGMEAIITGVRESLV